jgi:RNA polymerase primary sigma factor
MNNSNGRSGEIPQKFPDHEEMLLLFAKMKAGGIAGDQARNDLIVRNQGLVGTWANKYFKPGNPTQDYDDLFQAGLRGLTKAVDRFDVTTGYQLSTYATWWIRQSIQRQIADESRVIRIPVNRLALIKKVQSVASEMSQSLGHRPTVEEIAEELGMNLDDLRVLFDQAREATSLDDRVSTVEDDGAEKYNFVPDNNALAPDLVAAKSDECVHLLNWVGDVVEHMTHTMSARDRGIVCHRYGLMGFGNGKSLDDVGNLYSMTREGVRQITKAFFMKRSKLGLLIQSHYEMVQALKSITEGIELITASGLNMPPKFIRIFGGQVYTVENDDDNVGEGPVRRVVEAGTKVKKHVMPFNFHRFMTKLKDLMKVVAGGEESLVWLPAVVSTDFNVRLSTALYLSSGPEKGLVQDISLVPADKLASIRDAYTLDLLDDNLREVWKRQGKLFGGQVAEAKLLRTRVIADLDRRDSAIKGCTTLNPEVREAMMAWCGIDGTGRERDRDAFAGIIGGRGVIYTGVNKCWEVVSMGTGEKWDDKGYWNLRKELDILDLLLQ